MKTRLLFLTAATAALALPLISCSDDDNDDNSFVPETSYIGKAVGNFDASEWYPGGNLGTTENVSGNCYSDESPAVGDQGLLDYFYEGEDLFEKQYTYSWGNSPYKGLGPASTRSSCFDCHPEYGHGKWQASYTTSYGNGNGYLLVVYHPTGADASNSDGWSNDGAYVSEVTAMPQTQAQTPFLPPIDESKINLQWKTLDAMESGLSFTFPNGGDTYSLQYPEITIPEDAFNTDPTPYATGNVAVRLETTIGVIGTGLIDAIPSDSIKAQYKRESDYFKSAGLDVAEYINQNYYNSTTNDWGKSALYTNFGSAGFYADGTASSRATGPVKRFTYALTRGSLQDGPGANAIWNITNVTRPDRHYLYTTKAWAKKMSETPSVIDYIQKNGASENNPLLHPYYADGTKEGIAERVNLLLGLNTAADSATFRKYFVDPYGEEQTANQWYAFMVWHRGLSIPRARNLNDPDVQHGKELFYKWGCTSCHRPKWQTTDDNYWSPIMIQGKKLPQYKNQTIYPYSDFVQHKLYMKNDIHGSWCRTTPLWGRGLSLVNTGREDRLHDCRARNEEEAIMWHCYSKKSQAYGAAINFYNASKADRDAVIKFIRSI